MIYYGGIYLGNGGPENVFRIGIVMEYLPINLSDAIQHDDRLKSDENRLKVSLQIATGMNFLHSLNPAILVNLTDFFEFLNLFISSFFGCSIRIWGVQ